MILRCYELRPKTLSALSMALVSERKRKRSLEMERGLHYRYLIGYDS